MARHAIRNGTAPGTAGESSTARGPGQGSNSVQVRQFNERVILAQLRRLGTASKADLARHARLTANTAGQIVQELAADGLISIDGKRQGGRGQPATLLRLDPHGASSIGVEIGRRSLATLQVDFAGRVIQQRRHERPFLLPEDAVALVLDDVASMRAQLPSERPTRLAGLGIAAPFDMGRWRRELDLPDAVGRAWDGFDLTGHLAGLVDLPVFFENDGTAAAVAELFQGRGREVADFLYVFIGAATGGGVVIGGDYHRGAAGNGGDIGLMPTTPSRLASAPAPGGAPTILLGRASVNALVRHLCGNASAIGSREALDAAIAQAPSAAAEWLADCADALVLPLLAAASILDLSAIVLDGDLPRPMLDRLIAQLGPLLQAAAPEARPPPPLLRGEIGRQAAAIGAALLPLHYNYSPNRGVLLGH